MKKLLLITVLAGLFFALAACGSDDGNEVTRVTIGATPTPHLQILRLIAPALLEEGIELNLIEFTDFHLPNPALAAGDLDANYFQHLPFLNTAVHADELVMFGLVHIEPMGAYSYQINSIDELSYGATIAIPNDASNQNRALLLLQSHGLLQVGVPITVNATISDVTYNPLNLTIQELDAALLPRALDDPLIQMAVINTNHVLNATDLDPMTDSLIRELVDSPYANGLVIRREDEDNPVFATILRHLQSRIVYDFLWENFNGAVVPVFTP